MDNIERDIDQDLMQERDVANIALKEDVSFDSNPELDLKSKKNRSENENVKGENNKERLHDIIENFETKATCENTTVDMAKEEEGFSGGINGKNDKKRKCDPCLFDDIEENANAFCVICVEYLCKGCARDHRRSKATRNHTVLFDDEIPKDPAVFKMMKSLACCSDHPEMEIAFKCGKHEKFICNKCLVVSHRKCEEVTEASKVNRSLVGSETDSSLLVTLKKVHDVTVSVRIGKEENIDKLHLDHISVEEERSEFVKSLQKHLVKLCECSKTQTENILTKELNALEEEVDKCKEIENQEVKYTELLDVALNYGSNVELNVISELVKQEAENFKTETKKHKAKAAVHLKFERSQSFTDIATIGNVYVLRGDKRDSCQDENPRKQMLLENSSDVINEKSSTTGESLHKGPLLQSAVSRTRTMHYLHQTTSSAIMKCSITSMVVLSDGRVVVADHNNKSIKLLGLDFSVKKEYILDGKPIDMCETSKNYFALLFDGIKKVRKYTVSEKTVYDDGGFATKLYPISITKSQATTDHVVILFSDTEKNTQLNSYDNTIEVQIRSLENAIIKRFTAFNFEINSSPELYIGKTGRIYALPKVQYAFLISENEKLRCFETDLAKTNTLKENWCYMSSDKYGVIDEITDIDTDKEGNIYVCMKGSKNIHQISGSNFMNNRVLLSVPGTPLSICVDDGRRRVIVGCENDDFLYVATLQ
ncbi:uncharacterized protein LOC123558607 [Mercenaria mercenaria]|uniref:uncharacterized protein LOC123558607 n=1 Tax=Mercenaria mercenaria TaxID=6596 RepID=UPI00234E7A96|nr:uncharacterized protein LOC123558607 [Mercenaria mercenaria]